MNISQFYVSLLKGENALRKFGIFRMKGIKCINKDGVSSQFKSASIGLNYAPAYFTGLEQYDYDFLLTDQSFFQFECKVEKGHCDLRYAFYQNPIKHKSYTDYIRDEVLESWGLQFDEVGDLFLEDYYQYLNDQDSNLAFTTIRYDLDSPNYCPLIHPMSHIHIGHNNSIRIPVNKFLSPLKFILFVIKNVYYDSWNNMVTSDAKYVEKILGVGRREVGGLSKEQWSPIEELELFIT